MGKQVVPRLITDLIVTWESIEGDESGFVLKGATFGVNFGPWNQMKYCEILLFDFEHGSLDEKNSSGETVLTSPIELKIGKNL